MWNLGMVFENEAIAPTLPDKRPWVSVTPAKVANSEEGLAAERRWNFPMLPQGSFVATMFGWSDNSRTVSDSRSKPAVTAGKLWIWEGESEGLGLLRLHRFNGRSSSQHRRKQRATSYELQIHTTVQSLAGGLYENSKPTDIFRYLADS